MKHQKIFLTMLFGFLISTDMVTETQAQTTVYAATLGGGLSISTDAGATFVNRTTASGLGSNVVSGVFAITPESAESAIATLISDIEGLGIHHGTANSLIAELRNAIASLQRGNTTAAVNQLTAFINEVQAQRGKKLTTAQANQLIASAQTIINAINASSLPKQTREATLGDVPGAYQLDQNYPNPFNPTTTIQYALPTDARVTLVVYDVLGRRVAELVNGQVAAGYHDVRFEASSLSSGIYFYRLNADDGSGKPFTQIRKLMLMK